MAVGHNDGKISIRQIEGVEEADGDRPVRLDKIIETLNNAKDAIEVLKYSPSLGKLAAGSHDNAIYVYDV